MYRGYIKLWRKTLDSSIWENHNLFRFWVWCLLRASHQGKEVLVGFQKITLNPGQFVFGLHKAAQETGLSPRQSRTCINALKIMENLTIKSTNKYSIISIINWDSYQQTENINDNQPDKQATSKRQTSDNKQECKKNVKNDKNTDGCANALPPRRRQLPSDFVLTDELTLFATKAGIPENQVQEIFSQFCDHHRAKGTTLIDWHAGWRTWCRNEIKFNRGRRTPPEDIPGFDWSKDE